ncbi:hypothetical protein chiPu_0021811 [Chiloscyllium punctatum]|uniref:Uncharacterized protein n=1 Tax=Chiloscyllium punctatum TaxID=137246 RepID=A0A401RMM6_CHIPU|nr:hypothetical protein [Chiloscyllium punctatum]
MPGVVVRGGPEAPSSPTLRGGVGRLQAPWRPDRVRAGGGGGGEDGRHLGASPSLSRHCSEAVWRLLLALGEAGVCSGTARYWGLRRSAGGLKVSRVAEGRTHGVVGLEGAGGRRTVCPGTRRFLCSTASIVHEADRKRE